MLRSGAFSGAFGILRRSVCVSGRHVAAVGGKTRTAAAPTGWSRSPTCEIGVVARFVVAVTKDPLNDGGPLIPCQHVAPDQLDEELVAGDVWQVALVRHPPALV